MEILHITIEGELCTEIPWKIIHMDGRYIVGGICPRGQQNCSIDLSALIPGVYILEVSVHQKMLKQKIIKAR
jgi:hypothetical protein